MPKLAGLPVMQHISLTAALPEVQTTKSASHTRSPRLSLREIKKKKDGEELSCTSKSTGGAERQVCHTPKGSLSTTRFHKAPPPLKRRSLSLFAQGNTFQTCGRRMPNAETQKSLCKRHQSRGHFPDETEISALAAKAQRATGKAALYR